MHANGHFLCTTQLERVIWRDMKAGKVFADSSI